jgi:hypothetical protein
MAVWSITVKPLNLLVGRLTPPPQLPLSPLASAAVPQQLQHVCLLPPALPS